MSGWLLDTNVVSEVHRPRPQARVLALLLPAIGGAFLLVGGGARPGHTFSQPDLIVAATALHHGLTVVTRDTTNYARARLPLFNPWSDEAP